ncbi:hypothetical protein [Novosphingobium sp. PC22D]|uniref:hypothetical protein n=1 Tax=Novosphingobium sp. PC22D TaxID=1962403 RepID=UPI0014390566|nr:hypothetical protein [Novosphingobium sp. PC22D]
MEFELGSTKILTFHVLLVLSVILAVWKGDAPERCGAAVVMAMDCLQLGSILFIPRVYIAVDMVSVVVDGVGFLGFAAIAVHAMRIWPLWAAALQLISLSAHFARHFEIDVEPMVYAVMKSAPTFLVIVVLLIGTLVNWLRRARRGSVPSWQTWPARGGRSGRSNSTTSRR